MYRKKHQELNVFLKSRDNVFALTRHHPIPINPSWVSHYTTAESQLLQMWPTKPGIVCLLKRGTSKTRSSAQKCWKWPCVVLGKQVLLDFLELTIRKQFLKACCLWSTQTFILVSAQKFQLCILWCVQFENIRKPNPKPLALKRKFCVFTLTFRTN